MPDVKLPDEHAFWRHINSGAFQNGVDRGWWRLLSVDWPIAMIEVAAAPRPNSLAEYVFRFDCANYPQAAPTAQPWNAGTNAPLESVKWPGGIGRMSEVFRPNFPNNNVHCLYAPCDRMTISYHPEWQTVHPSLFWTPKSKITLYLGFIHGLLNSPNYTGACGA